MLGDKRAVAFIATALPDESLVFYRDRLGLELVEDSPFALVFACPNIMLRVQKVTRPAAAPNTVFGWDVGDIRATMTELRRQGIEPVDFPGLDQDDDGIWQSPSGAMVAWFRNPDGNVLSLTQFDEV
jgi:catechol 2,3-dioxygenase-like lactoylglutathione lyase family enzyme